MFGTGKFGRPIPTEALLVAFVTFGLHCPKAVAQSSNSQSSLGPQDTAATTRQTGAGGVQGISASAVAGKLPRTPQESPEELLEAEHLARRVPDKAKAAILAAIKSSNLPTSDDSLGGFHEESGVGGEAGSGGWVNSPGKPGPYYNPAINRLATMEELPANQHLRNMIAQPEVFWHVHPAGTVKVGAFTYYWEQAPSDVDRAAAAPGAINIVIGARDETVYFYSREGPILTLSLQEFLTGHS